MPERRMTKKEVALRGRYHTGAKAIVERHGATLLQEHAPEGDRRDTLIGPVADYELMTDAGRLVLHVYDSDTMTAFDRPKRACRLVDCNPHSGKWNHHTDLDQRDRADDAFIDRHLDMLDAALDKVNARPFVRADVSITPDEADGTTLDALEERLAFGENLVVEGFDQAAAAEEMASRIVDVDGGNPEWLVSSSRKWLLGQPGVLAYRALAEMRGRLDEPDASSTPGMR